MGQSRNENILENILGASNPLGEPQSREEALLMQLLEKLDVTVLKWLGVTSTELSDGATTNPITINSEEVTATTGDTVTYGAVEFVYNGTAWQEFGDLSNVFPATLTAGETTVTITDSAIAIGSMIEIYPDVYGLEPTNVAVTAGQIVLTYDEQGVDIHIKVKVI